jgi:tetratricopeptide (TPR) repeat protein
VTCARCGSLLGPRVRRGEDSGMTTTTSHRLAMVAQTTALDPDEPTHVYRAAAGARGDAGSVTGSVPPVHADARPLLGQAHAEAELQRALREVIAEQRARMVVVQAAPGAGKTRMLHRASELGARESAAIEVHCAALRSRDDGPYAPFSRLLLDRFGVTPASSPTGVRQDMESTIAEALGASTQIAETAHLVGHVAGVPFPESVLLRELTRDAASLHEQALQAVARFAAAEARARPQLWLLDELTDAQAQAFELLDALLDLRVPLLIVATGGAPLRERALSLRNAERVNGVELAALSEAEAVELVRVLLPGLVDLPAELMSGLMHRSSGNPQKLVELLRALQDAGLFRRDEHGLVVDRAQLEHRALPMTMADSIRARLSTLPAFERRTLCDAAIVGEHFWAGALLSQQRARDPLPESGLSALQIWSPNDDELALQQALDSLEAKGFIVRVGDGAAPGLDEYSFAHAGTRGVAYADLSKDERATGHARVARWLALSSGLVVESMAALIAPHLERAGAHDRAARAYLQAVADERARMRPTMALSYAEKALNLVDREDVPKRIEALHERGSLLGALGRNDEARAVFEEIVRLSWVFGAHGRGALALQRIARIERERGEYETALEHLRAALSMFGSIGDQRGVASSHDDMAQLRRLRGELEPALEAAKQALHIRKEMQDRRAQAASMHTIARIEYDLGHYDAAEIRFATALKIREAIGDHEGTVQTRIHLGQLVFGRGRVEEAIRFHQAALERARELHHQRFQCHALMYLGVAYLKQSDTQRAERALRDAKHLASVLRDQRVLSDIEPHLSSLAANRPEAPAPR